MPYHAGQRLGGETASKLGHLDVLKSDLVNQIVQELDKPTVDYSDLGQSTWLESPREAKPLRSIFAVDGSLQTVSSNSTPKREISFIKTALLHLDPHSISKIDPVYPHPNALRAVMKESALYHATAFPMKNILIQNLPWLDGIRKIIFDSFRDPTLDAEPFKTLMWIIYKKWIPNHRSISPSFECPDCNIKQEGMAYDSEESKCKNCGCHLYVTDVLGLHMEAAEESAGDSLSTAYMLIHETMLLFTAIRFFWEKSNMKVLEDTLFLKDGPLTLRGQYSKIVPSIREFLQFAKNKGVNIHICGQEKTGKFVDYLEGIQKFVSPLNKDEPARFSILSHNFIRREIQRARDIANMNPYGSRTNYGEKILLKQNSHHFMVLSVPTGNYLVDEDKPNSIVDLIGLDRILATVPKMLSYRHECALVPIELVNGIASLSSYPSATVLKLFSGLD